MTYLVTNAVVQHGGLPVESTTGVLTFHFGPGTPLWCVVKAVVWVVAAVGMVPTVVKAARWTTVIVREVSPARWCTRMTPYGHGVVTTPSGVVRPVGYDFARWRWCARVTTTATPAWLVRPRYV